MVAKKDSESSGLLDRKLMTALILLFIGAFASNFVAGFYFSPQTEIKDLRRDVTQGQVERAEIKTKLGYIADAVVDQADTLKEIKMTVDQIKRANP